MFMQQNSFQFKKKITMKNIPFLYSLIPKKYHAHAQRSSYLWHPPPPKNNSRIVLFFQSSFQLLLRNSFGGKFVHFFFWLYVWKIFVFLTRSFDTINISLPCPIVAVFCCLIKTGMLTWTKDVPTLHLFIPRLWINLDRRIFKLSEGTIYTLYQHCNKVSKGI